MQKNEMYSPADNLYDQLTKSEKLFSDIEIEKVITLIEEDWELLSVCDYLEWK